MTSSTTSYVVTWFLLTFQTTDTGLVLPLVDSTADLTCSWPFRSMGFKCSTQQSTVTEESFQPVSDLPERCRSLSSYITQILVISFNSGFLLFKIQNVTGRSNFSIWIVWYWQRDNIPWIKWSDNHLNSLICKVPFQKYKFL